MRRDASSPRSFPNGSASRCWLKTVAAQAATSATNLRHRRNPMVIPSLSLRHHWPAPPASTRISSSTRARISSPISPAGQNPLVVVVRSSLPVKSLKELVDYAKANPGKLNYASSGHGTTAQLASELFLDLAKIKIMHVAYKSAGDVMIALLSGEADMGVVGPPAVLPQLQSGKVRVLAVLRDGKERLKSLPDVPTTQEAGIDNCEVSVWYGIFAPAGTPRNIINRLNAEWTMSAKTPQTIDMMNKVGLEPLTSTPEEYAKFFKAEIVRWARSSRMPTCVGLLYDL